MPEWTEAAGIAIGLAGLALAGVAFYFGFKRHDENTKGEDNRHKEAMAKQDVAMKAQADGHEEAMARQDVAMKAQADSHREAMTALRALIHNTAPRPGPAE